MPSRNGTGTCSATFFGSLALRGEVAVLGKHPFYNALALDRANFLWEWRDRGEKICD